jgi:hypothetical protein
MDELTRRRVLAGAGGVGVAGLAGCSGVTLGGRGEPCKAAIGYVEAILKGNVDEALGYVPYQYQPEKSEADAREQTEAAAGASELLGRATLAFNCWCSEPLPESEYDAIGADFGDSAVTAAQDITLRVEFSAGGQSQSQSLPVVALEIDGDGWYVIQSSEGVGEC